MAELQYLVSDENCNTCGANLGKFSLDCKNAGYAIKEVCIIKGPNDEDMPGFSQVGDDLMIFCPNSDCQAVHACNLCKQPKARRPFPAGNPYFVCENAHCRREIFVAGDGPAALFGMLPMFIRYPGWQVTCPTLDADNFGMGGLACRPGDDPDLHLLLITVGRYVEIAINLCAARIHNTGYNNKSAFKVNEQGNPSFHLNSGANFKHETQKLYLFLFSIFGQQETMKLLHSDEKPREKLRPYLTAIKDFMVERGFLRIVNGVALPTPKGAHDAAAGTIDGLWKDKAAKDIRERFHGIYDATGLDKRSLPEPSMTSWGAYAHNDKEMARLRKYVQENPDASCNVAVAGNGLAAFERMFEAAIAAQGVANISYVSRKPREYFTQQDACIVRMLTASPSDVRFVKNFREAWKHHPGRALRCDETEEGKKRLTVENNGEKQEITVDFFFIEIGLTQSAYTQGMIGNGYLYSGAKHPATGEWLDPTVLHGPDFAKYAVSPTHPLVTGQPKKFGNHSRAIGKYAANMYENFNVCYQTTSEKNNLAGAYASLCNYQALVSACASNWLDAIAHRKINYKSFL
ncbi:MAG: hypothetical protein ABW189_06815 [Rickettsiales bacterium]